VARSLADADSAHSQAREAAEVVADLTGVDRHHAVIVLGSGWAGAADRLGDLGEVVAEVPMGQLPHFRVPVAPGHLPVVRSLRLFSPDGRDVRVLAFLGRTHLYEGHGPAAVAHAVRTGAAAGCRTAVLTNANGSLRPEWGAGTGVVLRDHLNLSYQTPLSGPAFVDLTTLYTPALRTSALAADATLVEGVYAMLRGPHYETVAEALMLRRLGADVVGMSTVLEAIAAREAGMEVLALSVVTTVEATPASIDPDEVVRVAARSATRMGAVIATVLTEGHARRDGAATRPTGAGTGLIESAAPDRQEDGSDD
jgi:purine-nucleoside phosphorylase